MASKQEKMSALQKQIDELSEELSELKATEDNSKKQLRNRFPPKRLHPNTTKLVIGTSRVKYLDPQYVGCAIHSFSGATIQDLIEVIDKYQKQKVEMIVLICGYNDHDWADNTGVLWTNLIDTVKKQFSPNKLIIPKTISTLNNKIAPNIFKINQNLSWSVQKYIQDQETETETDSNKHIKIWSPSINDAISFNGEFSSSFFSKDGIHLSAPGNKLLSTLLYLYLNS